DILLAAGLDSKRHAGCRQLSRIAGGMQRDQQRLRVGGIRIRTEIAAEGKLESRHRFDVSQYVILGALSRGRDREVGITPWVEADVSTHRFHELRLVLAGNIDRVVHHIETGETVLEVEGLYKAVKLEPTDRTLAGEQGSQPVQAV